MARKMISLSGPNPLERFSTTFTADYRFGPLNILLLLLLCLAGLALHFGLHPFDLPTVRQLSVDLSVNPNTVSRAYTELELTGLVETHMGSGTFVGNKPVERDEVERRRILDQICQEFLSRASSHGFTLDDILENLTQRKSL